MTVEELLEGWAAWLCRPSAICGSAKHPLARLMDGQSGGAPVYCSILPYGLGLDDDSVFARVDSAVAALPPRYKQAVCLKYRQRADDEHHAAALGISLNAFRIRLCRAKECLLKSAIFVDCAKV